MQYYTTQPEQDPSPVARVDSLNTFLQDVFPEVNDGPGATGGVINRAMPKEEIREMERNMKIREKAEKRAAKEERRRLGLEKGFLEKYVPTTNGGRQGNETGIKMLTSLLSRSRSFFLSLSSSSSSPGLCPDRKIFWRRSTAPATVPVAGQTLAVAAPLLPDAPSVSSLDAPENQNAQNTQGMNGTIMPTVKVTSPTPVNGEGTQNEEMVTEKTEGPAVKKEVPGEQGDKKEQGGEEEHTGFVGSLKRIFTLRLGARRSTN